LQIQTDFNFRGLCPSSDEAFLVNFLVFYIFKMPPVKNPTKRFQNNESDVREQPFVLSHVLNFYKKLKAYLLRKEAKGIYKGLVAFFTSFGIGFRG